MLTKITFGYLKHSGVIEETQVRNTPLCQLNYPWLRLSRKKKKIKEGKAETLGVEEGGYLLKLFKWKHLQILKLAFD